jgi:AcrR family transcriptional regulator
LTHSAVVAAAADLVDGNGERGLTIASLAAELGIKPPSLYNHVENFEQLRRDVALQATIDLSDVLRDAVMGRSGGEALRAVAAAARAYARAHPDLYRMTAVARPEDTEYVAASMRAVEPILAVLRSFKLHESQAIHAARTLRAAIHGFVSLETTSGFGLDTDVDESFEWMISALIETLETGVSRQDRLEY